MRSDWLAFGCFSKRGVSGAYGLHWMASWGWADRQ